MARKKERPVLKPGDRGLRVLALQRRLDGAEGVEWDIRADKPWRDQDGEVHGNRITLKADGVYGPATGRAVKQFEWMHGLHPDGRAGRKVLRKLSAGKLWHKLQRKRRLNQMKATSRKVWGAAPPRGSIGGVIEPTHKHFGHCTVTAAIPASASVATEMACMRSLQQIAFARGFFDISYSFVIFPSGRIYEGRGWGKAGAHTEGYNSTTYATSAYIPCAGEPVTQSMINSFILVGRAGLRRGSIAPDVQWLGHRDVSDKSCPGDPIYSQKTHIGVQIRRGWA